MKIVRPIRDIYHQNKTLFEDLKKEIEETLKPKVEENNWFFVSRIKGLESFALKIETGRVDQPNKLEDFYACTIIVPTTTDILDAEILVKKEYKVQQKRPKCAEITHKASSDFVFDELRLYVTQGSLVTGKQTHLNDLKFEVQIKTILQYAWGIATHDLIYKSDTVSWPRERIAFQVRAMLEHAEVAITNTERLLEAPNVAKTNPRTEAITSLIAHLNAIWPSDNLPKDVKRLAVSIYELFRNCRIDVAEFPQIVDEEKLRLGTLPNDISPYALTVQALANNRASLLKNYLNATKKRGKIVIHNGMDLPSWIVKTHSKIVNMDSS